MTVTKTRVRRPSAETRKVAREPGRSQMNSHESGPVASFCAPLKRAV